MAHWYLLIYDHNTDGNKQKDGHTWYIKQYFKHWTVPSEP